MQETFREMSSFTLVLTFFEISFLFYPSEYEEINCNDTNYGLPNYATVDKVKKQKERKEKFEKIPTSIPLDGMYEDLQSNYNSDVYHGEIYTTVVDNRPNEEDNYDCTYYQPDG